MSETKFAIIKNPIDYDDYPSAIGYVDTVEEAEELCEKLTNFYKQMEEYSEGLLEKVKHITDKDLELEDKIDIPKWASGLAGTEITPEMRAERNEIVQKNNAIDERNRERWAKRSEEITEFVAKELDLLDEGELGDYIKSMLKPNGRLKEFLFPYTHEEIKKLS